MKINFSLPGPKTKIKVMNTLNPLVVDLNYLPSLDGLISLKIKLLFCLKFLLKDIILHFYTIQNNKSPQNIKRVFSI